MFSIGMIDYKLPRKVIHKIAKTILVEYSNIFAYKVIQP